jgi:hypothetical protein
MTDFKRYAVYYAPPSGAFARRANAWLGASRPDTPLPPMRSWAELTAAPRKYGFHGTLRAPFRLADGMTKEHLHACLESLAHRLPPVEMPALEVIDVHRFLALVPRAAQPPAPTALDALAAAVVIATNPLRAALTEAEIARRSPDRLTPRQRALLDQWGYPYVMEDFRFHLTLTDQLLPQEIAPLRAALTDYFAPVLPHVFSVQDLCLFGEDAAGAFHLLHRYALRG